MIQVSRFVAAIEPSERSAGLFRGICPWCLGDATEPRGSPWYCTNPSPCHKCGLQPLPYDLFPGELWPCDPPPWPVPESEDPELGPRIRAIDEASSGPSQRLPPSRTLAEACHRARERWALVVAHILLLRDHERKIHKTVATHGLFVPELERCTSCGMTETGPVIAHNGLADLEPMAALANGRPGCDRCREAELRRGQAK